MLFLVVDAAFFTHALASASWRYRRPSWPWPPPRPGIERFLKGSSASLSNTISPFSTPLISSLGVAELRKALPIVFAMEAAYRVEMRPEQQREAESADSKHDSFPFNSSTARARSSAIVMGDAQGEHEDDATRPR